ncbi:MAG: response regulator [Verrucomicrobia bacterium]|nr:response regulator [Verrucomicrobiota bacterium]
MTKKRILAIDDEPSITRLLKLNLEQTGLYEVREENFSTQALDAAREFKPDLVISDVMMPEVGGGEVAALLREDPALRRVPVIFLTAAVRKEELGGPEAVIAGRLYIAKPLDVKSLLAAIERILSK